MKRRGVLLLTSIVVMVVVGAGVALAASITCSGGNCLGTNGSDVITGTGQTDYITAASGSDLVNAKGGADEVYGDRGNDTLNGQGGNDYVEAGRGENVARGNGGNFDVVNVVDGDGNDFASGGDGTDDLCIVDSSSETQFAFDQGSDAFADSCEIVAFAVVFP